MTDPTAYRDACAREPIRIPGAIQPHGALLVVAPTGEPLILQASVNARPLLGLAGGQPLPPGHLRDDIALWAASGLAVFRRVAEAGGRLWQVMGHRSPQGLILEFEPAAPSGGEMFEAVFPHLRAFLDTMDASADAEALCRLSAAEIRSLTGFNRVLVYRFDLDWHGSVIAEDGDGVLPSYLGLHFPASDIPAQARDLYAASRLRLIPDASYRPVPIEPPISPLDQAPLDLSHAALRSVSPVHLKYMANMGTAASMSVSLVIDGKLWGLVSCHHATPRHVGPHVAAACDTLGQVLSQGIGARERMAEAERRLNLKNTATRLLERLAAGSGIADGLVANTPDWLALTHAQGAAVVVGERISLAGQTPPEQMVRQVADWLRDTQSGPVFVTDRLPEMFPSLAPHGDQASGLVAVSLSQIRPDWVMWFRPEVVRTVDWGGDPRPSADGDHLHPRRSFALWQEHVRGCSLPWAQAEIDAASELRSTIINIVLRQAEEKAMLSEDLSRSNRELESFSYSVSHDLRAPFRHVVGYAELLSERIAGRLDETERHYLRSISESALAAGRLVDDLLDFARLNRAQMSVARVDMRKLVEEARLTAMRDAHDRAIEWRIGALPDVRADAALLRQALVNLLSNAVKFTRERAPAIIEVMAETGPEEIVFTVRDNGVGFDMAYAAKLFGVFQRLHRMEEFEGTGIGLAICKRVIERHGGWVRAEGALDDGASFTFGLPDPARED